MGLIKWMIKTFKWIARVILYLLIVYSLISVVNSLAHKRISIKSLGGRSSFLTWHDNFPVPYSGKIRSYFDDGKPKGKGFYLFGLRVGRYEQWYNNGQINIKGRFLLGLPADTVWEFRRDGSIYKYSIFNFRKGIEISNSFHASGDILYVDTTSYLSNQFHRYQYDGQNQLEARIWFDFGKHFKPLGIINYYPETGNKKSVHSIDPDKEIRTFWFYYPDGSMKMKGHYNILTDKKTDTFLHVDTLGRVNYRVFLEDSLVGKGELP